MATPEQHTDAAWRTGIERRLKSGERLTDAEAVDLLGCDDLSWLGGLAHRVRTEASGARTVFVALDVGAEEPSGGEASDGVALVPYGRDESPAERARALLAVRSREVPPRLVVHVRRAGEPPVSPAESLKFCAMSRLLLDPAIGVGCDLGTHSASTGALLQHFGASALVVPTEGFDPDEIAELVQDAGFTPVQADADGRELRVYDAPPSQADRRREPQSVFS